MHYRNDLSALLTPCSGCSRGAVLPKVRKSTSVPKVNGSGYSPRGCGIRDEPEVGFRCLNRCPCCCSHPSSSRQGWHGSHTELCQTCPQHSCCLRPPGLPRRELAPYFQAAGIHQQCFGMSSSPWTWSIPRRTWGEIQNPRAHPPQ